MLRAALVQVVAQRLIHSMMLKTRRASISGVQRQLRIGYNRAARLIEDMERAGLVSAMQSNGNREVLVPHHDS